MWNDEIAPIASGEGEASVDMLSFVLMNLFPLPAYP